jgi:predicted RNA methylase
LGIREAIGVEVDRQLFQIALENASHIRGWTFAIAILNARAEERDRSKWTVFYLFDPPNPQTMHVVRWRVRKN